MATIGIDATGLWGMTFGIHIYAGRLIEHLLPLAPEHDFTIYCRKAVPASFQDLHPRVRFRVAPFRHRKFCEQVWLSYEMGGADLSLFHATFGRPLYCPAPVVITVHDLFTLRHPERYTALLRTYTRVAIERAARRAAAIVTPSEASRRDVIELLGVPGERVTTVPLGVDLDRFRPPTPGEIAAVRARHGLPGRFLLHVGGFSPIKNTERLAAAFARVCREPALAGVGLVFAGKRNWQYRATLAAVQRLGIADRVTFTGYFPEEDLPALYGAAEALLYPSLIEGFGLPVLEAFACGTPVLTSDRGSLPEVAGDAALTVDPEAGEALADAMLRLARRPGERAELAACGRRRVRAYTWQRTAERTLEVYRRVLAAPPTP